MTKIVKASEMARIEPIGSPGSEVYMLAAGEGIASCVQRLIGELHLKPKICLLCGHGNNAGDAFAAGKILHDGGFEVRAVQLPGKESELCKLQREQFGGVVDQMIDFREAEILVDGLLGTGFHGQVEGQLSVLIKAANASKLPILAIDVPSGIDGDTGEVGGVAIRAFETIFLGLPKAGCFLGEAWNYVGNVHTFDFGLSKEALGAAKEEFFLVEDVELPEMVHNRHKYEAGYVVGLGGSPSMPGAPILASYAALRSGAGIVRLLHPEGMEAQLASAPYEVIRQGYRNVPTILEAMDRAGAVFVGPGMGTSDEALHTLKEVLGSIDKPCVIDADALTLLASHPMKLPAQTILTPHHGEMRRLLQGEGDLHEMTQAYCDANKVIVILKGAPTFIFREGEKPFASTTGDPGMATAGSGDVLTGMVASFLAQTKDPLRAAQLAVHYHGLAGELAALEESSYGMIASDIIEALPEILAN